MRHMIRSTLVLAVSLVALHLGAPAAVAQHQAFFEWVGDLPGGQISSSPSAISADGRVVVGSSDAHPEGVATPRARPFAWDRGTGITALPTPVDWGPCYASGVSADGSVILGFGADEQGRSLLVRWFDRAGPFRLELPDPQSSVDTVRLSDDGETILLHLDDRPYLWSLESGFVALPSIPDRSGIFQSRALSGDGLTVVGALSDQQGVYAYSWTSTGGYVELGQLPGGPLYTLAYAVNTDGSVITGFSRTNSFQFPFGEAFRWESGGLAALGFTGEGRAVSSDGLTIVGNRPGLPGFSGAFIWREGRGARTILSLLANAYDLPMNDWELRRAYGVSLDGRTFIGEGRNQNGVFQGWVASLGCCCPPDWNRSGMADSQDFFEFISDFFEGTGDYNRDGVSTSSDVMIFLSDLLSDVC